MRRLLWLLPIVLGWSLLVEASPKDLKSRDKPVEMTSRGGLDVDLVHQVGKAKGDVVIKREDVVVCCDEAEAWYSGDTIRRVECRGNVVIVRKDGTRAGAQLAVFEAKRDRLTLTGDARVRSASADLSGEVIVYDIGTDRLNVKGKRSRFNFRPKSSSPVGSRECPPSER